MNEDFNIINDKITGKGGILVNKRTNNKEFIELFFKFFYSTLLNSVLIIVFGCFAFLR